MTLLLQESTATLYVGHSAMLHTGSAVTGDPRWMDISPLNMSPLLASGELLAMTCFDRFVVEAFFTPKVVPLLQRLLFGDSLDHRLFQVECLDSFVTCKVEDVCRSLVRQGICAIGILREPVFTDGRSSTFAPG